MSDEPRVIDNAEAGRYEIVVGDTVAGYAEYQRRTGTIAFTHTVVDSAYEGRGLGSRLVAHVLDAARADGVGVLPFCPFVRSWIERHPAYVDLVPPDQRARFSLGDGAS